MNGHYSDNYQSVRERKDSDFDGRSHYNSSYRH